ncbi:daunorubicin resistance protein DrrA family ABC transporter ATP-binding protein [Paenibacillus assamensis]|uniref:daunorubicin resistance protein DrrA family ABC transporter ATP-binding protein n=1 Tax=Paenibacillus assamensis TaxID=311244 RepID=UPI00042742A1|nr:daunorubicin resistance protein DrrA family ABC transporter ATP-binding protein [Paenibacillus assamensis]
MPLAIEVNGLRKAYNGAEVVKGIDLQVKKGELLALLGPNGAGKTTIVSMLSTLIKPDGGTALVAGYDAAAQAHEVRRNISLTGQFAALDEGLTGHQNIVMIARLYGYSSKNASVLADELIASFGLSDAKDRIVQTYSGGMRRRLDIIASVINQPEIIFLDEPTTGLDLQSRMQVWDVVRTLLKRGTTVLLTTQYLEEADQLADRIVIIDKGSIVAEGTPTQLKASTGGKTLSIQLQHQVNAIDIERLLASQHLTLLQNTDPLLLKIPVTEARCANQIIQLLLENDTPISHFSLSDPSMDEVFLTLLQSSSKEVVL